MSEHANEAPYFIGIEPPDNGSEQNDEQRTQSPPYDIMLSAKKNAPGHKTERKKLEVRAVDYLTSVPVNVLVSST